MQTTVVIQIGNSDDKLSQIEWSAYIHAVNSVIDKYADEIHFTGFSSPTVIWQNACWVVTLNTNVSTNLWAGLESLLGKFNQNNIAWTEGITVFIDA